MTKLYDAAVFVVGPVLRLIWRPTIVGKENIPHNIYNPGPKPAVCISAMTPSVFVSTVHP